MIRLLAAKRRKLKKSAAVQLLNCCAAAVDQMGKGTLAVPFHTILPSDMRDRAGLSTR